MPEQAQTPARRVGTQDRAVDAAAPVSTVSEGNKLGLSYAILKLRSGKSLRIGSNLVTRAWPRIRITRADGRIVEGASARDVLR